MKLIKNLSICLCLLSCFTTVAQVTQIPFNPLRKVFTPQIIWNDNKLFITHPNGIFYQDYSSGELPQDWGERNNHKWGKYCFAGHEVNDFVINENKIIAVTSNPYPEGEIFIRSFDGGKTYENFTPKEIAEFIEKETYFDVKPSFLIQNSINKNELLLECRAIFRSIDFGETWEIIPDFYTNFVTAKYHPSDPHTVILGYHSFLEYYPNGNFSISHDGGKTFNPIMYDGEEITEANTIAFHYANPDIIVIGGYPCIKTTDKGNTWEVIEGANSSGFDFDTRGTDRMYRFEGNSLLYSDDYGINWNTLCEINLENDDQIIDFTQHDIYIYTYSKKYKVHQIDLSILETAIDEVTTEEKGITLSVVGNVLKITTPTSFSLIEIYDIAGNRVLSHPFSNGITDISDLMQGTYVARLTSSDKETICIKFYKPQKY